MDDFARHGAEVVGVSRDSAASHAKFAARHGLRLTLLSDPSGEVLRAYGVLRPRKMYGKEVVGVVRSTLLIDPEGIVRRTWPKVAKAAGHAREVLEALAAAKGA